MKPTFQSFSYFLITCFFSILYGKSISTNLVLSSATPTPNDVIFQWPQYTFKVDFKDTISNIDSTKHINSDGVMAIALYTNKSFLGGDCSNYLPFNCSDYNCFPSQEKQRGLSHPYFEFEGYTLHTELYLDYTFFSNPSMNMIYAQKCSDNLDMTPQKIHGMLGMGLEGFGINNFMGQYPTFSIFLEEDSSKRELIFDCDERKINETGLHQNVVSTKNWEVPYQDIIFHEKSFKLSGTTIFDINLPYIGLPAFVYEAILKNLKAKFNVTCDSPLPLHRRKCIFKGNLSNLPDIKLEPGITIPPQVYLKHTKNYNYKLNLIALSLDPEKTQPYIKVIQNFKRHVILGAPFMQYYYVCFEAKPKHCEINIYERDFNTGYDAQLMFILRVVGAVMIPFVLCIIFCCLSKRKEKKDTSDYKEIILKDEAGISRAFLSKEEVSVDFECIVEDGDLDAEKDDLKKVKSEGLLSTQVDSKLDQGLDSLVLP